MKKAADWENIVNLLLGVWLFIIQWTAYSGTSDIYMTGSMWNFWFVGSVIIVLATMALQSMKPWEEWINVVAGIWMILSPWIFGYSTDRALMWNSLAVGLIVTILSAFALPVALSQKVKRGAI